MRDFTWRPNRRLDERGHAAAGAARKMGFKSRLAQEVAYAAACFPGPNNLTYERTADLILAQFGTMHHPESIGRITRRMHRAGIVFNKRLMPGERYPGFKSRTEHGATSTVFLFKACDTRDPVSVHERRRMRRAAVKSEYQRRACAKFYHRPSRALEDCTIPNAAPIQPVPRVDQQKTLMPPTIQESRRRLAKFNPAILKYVDEIQRHLDRKEAARDKYEARKDLDMLIRSQRGRDPPATQ